MGNDFELLSFATYSDFVDWDVKQFFFQNIVSSYPIEKLGKHLIHQTEKIQPSTSPNKAFGILGVSNKKGMFDKGILMGKEVSQKYHVVENGWLAYNPYRINVGSIGIKTTAQTGKYISPAYVVFSCAETLVPEFALLLIKSNVFNLLIKGSTTGTVRQTLGFDRLAEISAPIPSKEEQEKLLSEYYKLSKRNKLLNEEANSFFADSLFKIQCMLSAFEKEVTRYKKNDTLLRIIGFPSTTRWEVDYIYKEGVIESIVDSFKYPEKSIGELQRQSLFGLSIKASVDKNHDMIPVLRMSNIQSGEIQYDDLKYLPHDCAVTDNEPDKWILKKGDFLITRTNGSKGLVGKSAVFDDDGTYTYASYLIRYRFDTNMVLPEYVNIVFMTPLVREQIAVMRRQGGGQYNLNSDEINSICIPVPDISKQEKIIQQYQDNLIETKRMRMQAKDSIDSAKNYFEKILFSEN